MKHHAYTLPIALRRTRQSRRGESMAKSPKVVRRYKGEEAQQLTASEWLAHQNRLMAMERGEIDFRSFLVEPPARGELVVTVAS